ncbi:serine/threonine-protein phosphatase [Nocardioides anomalus]|uniref:Serine/threonine-protein phosphatase n=1 Tax=Nocardioides anomalus TaxID=2712223 RepID=A0A6G6WDC8_9ACTN|nr:PP2C family protein-serine/threonine phosphatase [Nocardioides anomalus]QIG43157.1 serine/threonine-protein phosphatase [Nocardioides anomalus]
MAVRAPGVVRARLDAWRTGSVHAQWAIAASLLALIGVSLVVSLTNRGLMPLTAYFLWLLVARILLSFRPLVLVASFDAVVGSLSLVLPEEMTPLRWVAVVEFLLSVALVLYVASRSRSSLPGTLSEVLLVDLKERLQAQGRVPALPEGWDSQTAMVASHGDSFAGDFLVADLRDRRLEVILVDVCGKGTAAGPAALQFAGALGGLIGAMAPLELMRAANAFLLRQGDEAFATAVHLVVDLDTGAYQIISAGHPPALRWDLPQGEWLIDNARGTALGVLPDPELHVSQGRLFHGEALLFYTDGVVETRTSHLDAGIAWLQHTALDAVGSGFRGAARRIINQVDSGDDDRAVLILSRSPVASRDRQPI